MKQDISYAKLKKGFMNNEIIQMAKNAKIEIIERVCEPNCQGCVTIFEKYIKIKGVKL